MAQESGPKLIITDSPNEISPERVEGEASQLEIAMNELVGREAEMTGFMEGYRDFVRSPETTIAERPEIKVELSRTREAGRNATAMAAAGDLIIEANPNSASNVEAARKKTAEQAAESEQNLEIAKLKAEISELNGVVQKSETLEKFGGQNGFNRTETYAFVEKEVLDKEARIRALEVDKRLLEKKNELKRLKDEINELNRTVQDSEGMKKYGEEFGFDKDKTYKAISDKVLANEQRIRELEGSQQPRGAGSVERQVAEQEGSVQVEAPAPALVQTSEGTPEGVVAAPLSGTEGVRERELSQAEKDHLLKSFGQENTKQPNKWWGWVKERAKGLGTFGFWEFHQAERFRSNKKEIAKDIATESETIERTTNLSVEQAQEEALILQRIAQGQNTPEGLTAAEYELYSNEISNRKIESNNARIEAMVAASSLALKERLNKHHKYQDQFGEVVTDNAEKMANFENGLRASLTELQDGQKVSSNKKFKKIITERLDPTYWHRYVYGALEMWLAAKGLALVVNKLATSQWWLGKKGADAVQGGFHGPDVNLPVENAPAAPTGDVPMHNTIWQTSREWLEQHGIAHPSNKEIMAVSKQVATDNGIGVDVWNIPGKPLDTNMVQGHLLKFAGGAKIATAIKIARIMSAFTF